MFKQNRESFFLLLLILILMSVSPAFALGEDNRNVLLIGVMFLAPLVVLMYHKYYYPSDGWLLLFMGSIVFIPLIHQPESMRWSTVMYSCMFALTFMAYNRLLHRSYFSIQNYQQLLKYLIYSYFVVLLIQQFCVLAGLPVFNVSNYNPSAPWKLNSLAAEPSHSARIVALLMYCYLVAREIRLKRKYELALDFKEDWGVWFGFIWTMITMGSGTAFLFIPIVLFKVMRLRNLIPLFVLVAIMIYLADSMGINAFERTYKTAIATITLNEDAIIHADHSASIRIVPMIIISKMIDLTTWDGWLGHGIDYVSSFLDAKIPGVPIGYSAGGMFQVLLEYGFISFLIFVLFSFKATFNRTDYLSVIFWFLLIIMYGVNNQIVWLCIILLSMNNHFSKPRRLLM